MTTTATRDQPDLHAPPAPAPRSRRGWKLALRVAISLGLLTALLSQVDLGGVAYAAMNARGDLILLLLILLTLERGFGAWRWHLLLRTQGVDVSFATTFRAIMVGGFVGTFLPGGLGIEAVRIAVMSRAADFASAASSVLADRILGSLALIVIVLVALLFTTQPVPLAVPITAVVVGVVLLLMSMMLMHRQFRRVLQRLVPSRRRGTLHRELQRFAKAVRLMRRRPGMLAKVAGLSVLFQVLRVSIAPVTAVALGLDIPLGLMLIYVPIIMFLMMMPISIAGLGVREAAFVYFFGAQYVTPEQALALSLLMGLLTLVMQLPGAIFCITGVRPRNPPPATWPAPPLPETEQR